MVKPFVDAGMEVLYCTEDIDEFTLNVLMSYAEHEFRSVSEEDLDLPDEKKKALTFHLPSCPIYSSG